MHRTLLRSLRLGRTPALVGHVEKSGEVVDKTAPERSLLNDASASRPVPSRASPSRRPRGSAAGVVTQGEALTVFSVAAVAWNGLLARLLAVAAPTQGPSGSIRVEPETSTHDDDSGRPQNPNVPRIEVILIQSVDSVIDDPMVAMTMRARMWDKLIRMDKRTVVAIVLANVRALTPESAYEMLAKPIGRSREQRRLDLSEEERRQPQGIVAIVSDSPDVLGAVHTALRDAERNAYGVLGRPLGDKDAALKMEALGPSLQPEVQDLRVDVGTGARPLEDFEVQLRARIAAEVAQLTAA